ncbi:MAG: NAD(P)-binding protein [Maledivibacter sp.]|jgi:flavin-dependent dehydrogenase|nr:NAD(P)-binding protein [Maledivibacter sp.]
MKVAIVGAGLSGLSCALELEKLGIMPEIFEMGNSIGDSLDYTIISMKIYNQFNETSTKYLKKQYGLKIKPTESLKRITMHGPNSTTTVKGRLGYIFEKNKREASIENQIYKKLKSNIHFDSYVDPIDLSTHFDYVVCATGNSLTAEKLNIFTRTFYAQMRIATILGDFNSHAMELWFNKEYAKNGYIYILPHNGSKAILALIVDNISQSELDYYWKNFLSKENLQYKILSTRDYEFNTGIVETLQRNNIFLIGNSGGLVDNFLGFGFISAIESGILTAKAIYNNLDINELLSNQINNIANMRKLRGAIDKFSNKDLDRLIKFLGLPIIKPLIYNNPCFKINNITSIGKLYNNFSKNRK